MDTSGVFIKSMYAGKLVLRLCASGSSSADNYECILTKIDQCYW